MKGQPGRRLSEHSMERFWGHGLRFWAAALKAWAVRGRWPLNGRLTVVGAEGRGREEAFRPGMRWGGGGEDLALLAVETVVPVDHPRLVLDVDGEALLRIDGEPVWGVNPTHRYVDLPLAAGRRLRLQLDLTRYGLMGRRVTEPALRRVEFQDIDATAWEAAWDLTVLSEWARDPRTPAAYVRETAPRLWEAVNPLTRLPADLAAWQAWLQDTGGGADEERLYRLLVEEDAGIDGLTDIDPDQLRQAVAETARRLRRLRSWLRDRYPKGPGRLVALGHAHIDWAWLWRVADTRGKVVRTVASQTRLLEQVPGWSFGMSSPAMWQALAEDAPALAERAERLAHDGRIVPLGAFWVEADGQLPDAASYLRHMAYTLRDLARRGGRVAPVAFLPDTFGFAAPLPTLLTAGGIRLFLTTKINWNDSTLFPYKDFWWVGPDGSAVQAHIFGQCEGGYNGDATLANLHEAWTRYQQEGGQLDRVLYTFGRGDGGGGPDGDMLERLVRYRDLPAVPEVEFAGPERLLASPDEARRLPRYRGELYLEFHRGVFTSQTRIKREMRELETWLAAVEAWGTWLGLEGGLEEAWTRLLANQFHDILPGSAIGPVYADWAADRAALNAVVEEHRRAALDRWLGSGNESLEESVVVLLNPSGVAVPPRLVTVDSASPVQVETEEGIVVSQATWDGRQVMPVPALGPYGVAAYRAMPIAGAPKPEARPVSDPLRVEWDGGAATIGAEGVLSLVWHGRELLEEPAGLRGFYNHPAFYDAWELDARYRENPAPLDHDPPLLLEDGPYRTVVRLRHRSGRSVAEARVAVDKVHGGVAVDVDAEVHDRHLVWRYEVPTTLVAASVAAETVYGTVDRPTEPGGADDAARFEWAAHRFVDLAEAEVGLAVINDGRYGHSAAGGRIGLTVSTAPLSPDPATDIRPSPVRVLLWPHDGDFRAGGVVPRAYALNGATEALWRTGGRAVGASVPVEGLPPHLRLLGLVATQDHRGVMLYLAETDGASGTARLGLPWPLAQAGAADLVSEAYREDDAVSLLPDGHHLKVRYRPYQIMVVRCDRR
jgi:alpha-mannosidase